jgi:hypothetical protein
MPGALGDPAGDTAALAKSDTLTGSSIAPASALDFSGSTAVGWAG